MGGEARLSNKNTSDPEAVGPLPRLKVQEVAMFQVRKPSFKTREGYTDRRQQSTRNQEFQLQQ